MDIASVSPKDLSPWLEGRSFDEAFAQFGAEGYLIFKEVLPAETVAAARAALAPYLEANLAGRNDFEGLKSNRVYALLAKAPIFADLVIHPLALAFAEAELGRSFLLSACLAINLHPGETVQPWHYDDSHMAEPLPRNAWGLSAFWAIDDMTEENGATEVIPGSHCWTAEDVGALQSNFHGENSAFQDRTVRPVEDDPARRPDAVKAVMPSGSLMVAKGTLMHRGGANRSQKSRLIVTPQYCVGWARQLENMALAVPPDIAATLPDRARELIGYSIHPPFMGYVDGVHPEKTLSR